MLKLSKDQEHSLGRILAWYKGNTTKSQYITLGGYAGTGKTTLIAHLRKELDRLDKKLKVAFISYTGKAARVLNSKLQTANALIGKDSVGTIHSLIYSPIVNERQEIIGWKQKETIDKNLIIIDEASMVDETIWHHLTSYQVPILAVGDHGQLPPISGSFNLMNDPQIRLEEIHRQALNNPIIDISIQARTHGHILPGRYSNTAIKYSPDDPDSQESLGCLLQNYDEETLVLCGYNKTRMQLNNYIRTALGRESPFPVSGDRVICLRNNHKKNIFNGMLGTIVNIERESAAWYNAEIAMDGELDTYKGLISTKQFNTSSPLNYGDARVETLKGDLFDFGYALTVHKAQGSQSRKVVLVEERFTKMSDMEWQRWLYTAVTRAEIELYIFPNSRLS